MHMENFNLFLFIGREWIQWSFSESINPKERTGNSHTANTFDWCQSPEMVGLLYSPQLFLLFSIFLAFPCPMCIVCDHCLLLLYLTFWWFSFHWWQTHQCGAYLSFARMSLFVLALGNEKLIWISVTCLFFVC